MSLVVRYVYNNEVYEFYNDPLTELILLGQVLADNSLKALETFVLDFNKCVGIGTDGCGVMMGGLKSAVAQFETQLVNAIKSSCCNHAINVSLSKKFLVCVIL